MYCFRTKCRACGNQTLTPVVNLGLQPLANEFLTEGQTCSGFAPLQVMFCDRCTLAQLSVVVEPEVLYRNYSYVTSPSQTMHDHFVRLKHDIAVEFGHGAGNVVEIGSNDGALLVFLQQQGFGRCVGIDPAANLAQIANARGVETLVGQFNTERAYAAKQITGKVDVVIARHVFAHIDNWDQFVDDLVALTETSTLVCIEVPDTSALLDAAAFDTIYHEHLSYVTVRAVDFLLQNSPLYLHRVIRYPIHGGSMLLMLRRRDFSTQRHSSVDEALATEKVTLERWLELDWIAKSRITRLAQLVEYFRVLDRRVCGYGASAKSSVWINACKFTAQQISFITDTTPQKIGKLSPGARIPIVPESRLTEDPKGLNAIMFAWNYRDEIVAKNKAFIEAGGNFILPVPHIDIIGNFTPGSTHRGKAEHSDCEKYLYPEKVASTSEIPMCANDKAGKITTTTS